MQILNLESWREINSNCKFCDSGNLKKAGIKKNKNGSMQRYACLDCKRRFTANFGFEKKQFDDKTITGAMSMYFSGMRV